MSLSQDWEKSILQHIFKRGGINGNTGTGGLPVSPNTIYFSLHSADPTDVHTTAQGNELSGLNYSRASLSTDANTSTHTFWNALDEPATAQRITNKQAISFLGASGNWNGGNPIGFFGMWTVAASGAAVEYLGSGVISPSVTILNGNTFSWQGGTPGNLVITVG